jgi:DNA-binding MarR family transcriptional regulator
MQLYTVNRTLADRLHSAAIRLLRRLRREDVSMGITPARASALSIMVFGGPVTIGSLAKAEQVTAPTATRLVVGMERDGLVRREGDEQDGRVVWLHPTAKGTKLLHEGRRRRVAALGKDLASLDAADRETLTAAVDILERMFSVRHNDKVGANPRARPELRRRVRPGPTHGSAPTRR